MTEVSMAEEKDLKDAVDVAAARALVDAGESEWTTAAEKYIRGAGVTRQKWLADSVLAEALNTLGAGFSLPLGDGCSFGDSERGVMLSKAWTYGVKLLTEGGA